MIPESLGNRPKVTNKAEDISMLVFWTRAEKEKSKTRKSTKGCRLDIKQGSTRFTLQIIWISHLSYFKNNLPDGQERNYAYAR